jgi:hypothetical protein
MPYRSHAARTPAARASSKVVMAFVAVSSGCRCNAHRSRRPLDTLFESDAPAEVDADPVLEIHGTSGLVGADSTRK